MPWTLGALEFAQGNASRERFPWENGVLTCQKDHPEFDGEKIVLNHLMLGFQNKTPRRCLVCFCVCVCVCVDIGVGVGVHICACVCVLVLVLVHVLVFLFSCFLVFLFSCSLVLLSSCPLNVPQASVKPGKQRTAGVSSPPHAYPTLTLHRNS